ncbi:MAG: hypothetical protein QOF98_15, partial [Streptomyces sp.]|nr:hypothetical protein [Streptomyces sp.]
PPPPPPPQGPPPGYGYPAPVPPPAPGPSPYTPPVPPGQNPYATPVPPAENPYAQSPPGGPRPPPPTPQQPNAQQPYGGQPYAQQPPPPPQAPQAPYGYPQQPYQGPPPAGQRGGNSKLLVIVAAVVAAVLVIGGGVYLATKGSGDDSKSTPQADSSGSASASATPQSSTLSLKWDKPADTVAEADNLKDALGVWFAGTKVVKNEIGKVVAYDLATGAQAWSIPAPSSGDCTAARDTYNNIAAIQYGANCDKIMAIDLAAGKPLWTQTLPGGTGSSSDFDYTEMAISGDTVGVDWLDGSIAYRLSTQKVLWRGGDGNCEDDGYAGGKQFVAVVNCDYTSYQVQLIDPDNNGNPKWSWTAPVGTKVSAIVSTDPVVVLLGTDAATYTDVATIVNGRMQSRVSLGTDKYDISDDGTEKQAVHNVLVSSDTLYLTLRSQSDGSGKLLSGIVAFNLSDGKQKWVAKPDTAHDITGLGFQDGKVLAYEPPGYDTQGRIVTLDPATGAITTYATFAQGAYDQLESGGLHDYFVWNDGTFVYVSKTVYASSTGQKYLQVFG